MEGTSLLLDIGRRGWGQVLSRCSVLLSSAVRQSQSRSPHHEVDVRLLQVVVSIGLTENRLSNHRGIVTFLVDLLNRLGS